uniref:Uncharacterized protein n=1 Tax=Arundo donax TaxID=35708 RepID=A0A0A9FXR1_ARUDO
MRRDQCRQYFGRFSSDNQGLPMQVPWLAAPHKMFAQSRSAASNRQGWSKASRLERQTLHSSRTHGTHKNSPIFYSQLPCHNHHTAQMGNQEDRQNKKEFHLERRRWRTKCKRPLPSQLAVGMQAKRTWGFRDFQPRQIRKGVEIKMAVVPLDR